MLRLLMMLLNCHRHSSEAIERTPKALGLIQARNESSTTQWPHNAYNGAFD
jgi:hypothetical protein